MSAGSSSSARRVQRRAAHPSPAPGASAGARLDRLDRASRREARSPCHLHLLVERRRHRPRRRPAAAAGASPAARDARRPEPSRSRRRSDDPPPLAALAPRHLGGGEGAHAHGSARSAPPPARRGRGGTSASSCRAMASRRRRAASSAVGVGTVARLRDDLVDDAQGLLLGGGEAHRHGRLLGGLGGAPQDARAALGRDDRVDGVLERQHHVPDRDGQRPARSRPRR